jgi:hypothetical protein
MLTLTMACGRAAGDIEIRFEADEAGATRVEVSGLSSDEVRSLEEASLSDAEWQEVLRVSVAGGPADQPGVAGAYEIAGGTLRFLPMFPFNPGRRYDVTLDRARVPRPHDVTPVSATLVLPAVERAAETRVTLVMPTTEAWPENLLRIYVEFSAPMSRTSGLDYVRLVDAEGNEVVDPFLPLDVEFWNADHTRYTLFLDPGRVKQGILPNEQLGRALIAGRTYAIEVDAAWRDANGLPLVEPYRQAFTAGPADESPVVPTAWRIEPPAAGSRDALVVTFPDALDHGLLQRAVGVARGSGESIPGDVTIGDGERSWRFVPASAWQAGAYDLVVLSILEDAAGNRVGARFEVDRFDRVDATPAPERTLIGFSVR